MELWMKVCGGALLCVVAIVTLRQLGRDSAQGLQWTGVLFMSGAGLLLLQPVVAFVGELAAHSGMSDMASLLLRGLGIAMLCQLCADFCRQSGEGGIATGVEMAGRAQLLLLALPKLQELLAVGRELMGMMT